MQEMQVPALGWEDPLEEETATFSSILAWEIPWTEEEPGGLQSMELQKSRTQLSNSTTTTVTTQELPTLEGAYAMAVQTFHLWFLQAILPFVRLCP